jgi:DNA invertase Pin-like site-specific DNA recombinase
MTERAGRWVAVSTGGQDERDQEPDIDRWIADHGYEPVETYRLHGVSRYKGTKRHDAELDRVIEDMRRGHIQVLTVWQSSRIERRGAYNAFDLARRVREAGGRIEYVKDAHLNMANDMADVNLALQSTMDRLSSKAKSDAVLKKHRALKERGSYVGRAKFGYHLVTLDPEHKMIEPNSDAETAHAIFEEIADGRSLRDVGEPRGMWPRTVQTIIRSETYKGRHHHGTDVLTVPAIVSPELWRRANDRLSGTRTGRRGRVQGQPALLTSVLYCGPCHDRGVTSPMYRGGNGDYYRCSGTGRAKRGCGHMLGIDACEIMAVHYMTSGPQAQERYTMTVTVPDDRQDRIETLQDELTDATKRRDRAGVNRIMDELEAIETEPAAAPRTRTKDMGMTIGQHWQSLDRDARRAWMLRDGWRMWAWKDAEYGIRLAAQERAAA